MSTSSRKDIEFKDGTRNKDQASKKAIVAASATLIYPGDPIVVSLGAVQVATSMATNKPVVATDYVLGISTSLSNNTAALAGTVDFVPVDSSDVMLISPTVAATWDTQAKYDALVGSRVLLDLTASKYTALAADGATYGCVIQPLEIAKYPGKVAFSFRAGCSPLA